MKELRVSRPLKKADGVVHLIREIREIRGQAVAMKHRELTDQILGAAITVRAGLLDRPNSVQRNRTDHGFHGFHG